MITIGGLVLATAACASPGPVQRPGDGAAERFRPGASVLVDDQLSLIRGRQIALVVDPSARDGSGTKVESLLQADRRVRAARVTVSATFRVNGALRSFEDDTLQARRVGAALDDIAAPVAAFVFDVPDRGSRTGPAPVALLATLRAAARRGVPVVVLDRPNPIMGERAEGPVPDSVSLASDALYGLPSRHGMTIGEIALWFNDVGRIGASVSVVPVRGWRRSWWPGEHDIPPARIDGGSISAGALVLAAALAPIHATNLSIAKRGEDGFQLGASWLDAARIARVLGDRLMPGVRFSAGRDRFGDGAVRSALPSLRIEITDRDRASGWRILAAILSTVRAAHGESLVIDEPAFDRISGSPNFRTAIVAGEDSDAVVDAALGHIVTYRRLVRGLLMY